MRDWTSAWETDITFFNALMKLSYSFLFAAMRPLYSLGQIRYFDLQGVRYYLQGLDGHIALTALDFPNMGAVKAGFVREYILR